MTMKEKAKRLVDQLNAQGFDSAIAIATDSEVEAGAACGQLCLVLENSI